MEINNRHITQIYKNNRLISWLTNYFYKVVFLKVVNMILFILQHNEMHELKIFVHNGAFYKLSQFLTDDTCKTNTRT
jgi:hypothetical protein